MAILSFTDAHAAAGEPALLAARQIALRLSERAAQTDARGEQPPEHFQWLHEAGLLGLTIAPALGGLGANLAQTTAVLGAIAHGDPSTALVLAMHHHQHAGMRRGIGWPAALSARLAARSRDGVALINSLQAEPALGSPSRGGLPATIARRHADGWRLSGHKIYCTGSTLLSFAAVLAVTDEAAPRVGYFVVPMEAPGVRIEPTWDHSGMRATASHDIVFDDVPVGPDDVAELHDASGGIRRDPVELSWYLAMLASIYDAVARAGRDWLLPFLIERKPASLNASLSTVPRIQEAVGGIDVLLETNRRLLSSLARDVDEGRVDAAQAALVKHVVVDNAVKALDHALELAGNHGLSRRNPLERHHRDVLCSRIHAPVNDIVRVNAGRAAFASFAAAQGRSERAVA